MSVLPELVYSHVLDGCALFFEKDASGYPMGVWLCLPDGDCVPLSGNVGRAVADHVWVSTEADRAETRDAYHARVSSGVTNDAG